MKDPQKEEMLWVRRHVKGGRRALESLEATGCCYTDIGHEPPICGQPSNDQVYWFPVEEAPDYLAAWVLPPARDLMYFLLCDRHAATVMLASAAIDVTDELAQ